ncbi:myopalladin isoform X2 [Antennarius striatus]|uniref:myopalladin isoform X2 n=1 Tax=Antennarius striatus TaxID=241820 RepID=UPI0035B42AD2
MQDNSEQPKSLSQLLRESYLAEARAQQRHGRSDPPSSRLQIYRSLKGKVDDSMGRSDPQHPDLSAFLSQEELDKSVNLARQAIVHESHEERSEVTPSSPHIYSACVPSEPPSVPSVSPSHAPFAPPLEHKDLPATQTNFTSDRSKEKAPVRKEHMIRSNRDPMEGFQDLNRSGRNVHYGPETQSKKEFLNKAADFIEELSSLFKANSSKRIRPRGCKTHRSRSQSKGPSDGTVNPPSPDDRERVAMTTEEKERPNHAVSHQTEVQLASGVGHAEIQDCRLTEEKQLDSVSQEVEKETESCPLAETPSPAEPVCEPPHFIQKLKSREVSEGSKVQLDCIVRGLPVPEVRWFCEGKELENSPDIQIITDGELHSLVITEAFEEDTGRYSCFASNFYGTDSTSAEIYVEGASSSESDGEQHVEHVAQLQRTSSSRSGQALSAEVSPQPVVPSEGPAETLTSPLTSEIIPEPLPLVQTSDIVLPAPELSEAPEAPVARSDQEETAVFSILSQTQAQETQELSTSVSVVSSVPPVVSPQIQPPPPESPQSQTSNHSYLQGLNSQAIMAAPIFTKSLQDLLTSEGQLVVLECRVKGVPSPRVDWYRDQKLIEDSPDFRILQKKPRSPSESEDICTLVIAEVLPEDSGMFTCTASNTFGTVSCTAALRVKGNGNTNHVRPFTSLIQEPPPSAPTVNTQLEVTVTNSIKPHSSTVCLDPLVSSTVRLDSLNSSSLRLDPHVSGVFRQDHLSAGLSRLEPPTLSSSFCLNATSISSPKVDPQESSRACPEPQSSRQALPYPKPFSPETSPDQEVAKPSVNSSDTSPKVKGTTAPQNGSSVVVPLPDPPANSCLKSGALTNHKDPRSSSRVGLHVHFKLPEDEEEEQSDASTHSDEDATQMSANKEPPPVRAKPKLDPAQLQLLHNQVLLEQRQETEPPTQTPVQPQSHTAVQIPIQSEAQSSHKGPLWSPRMHQEPPSASHQSFLNTTVSPQQKPLPVFQMTTAIPASFLSSSPAVGTTLSTRLNTSPATPLSYPSSTTQLMPPPLVTSTQRAPQMSTLPPLSVAPVTQMNTIHASHINLSAAVLSRSIPIKDSVAPPAPNFSADPVPTMQQIISPAPLLRSTHASLMNLTPTSHSFNYARPKEFIAAQTLSPVRSPSPTESPVPLLHELAAELNSSAASSPTLPVSSQPPKFFPTRVLTSPTSPPSLVSSPTMGLGTFLNSALFLRAQSPPQTSSPTSSSSTPSPIQNPVAFLSSVLPSLSLSQPTNSMGLPRGAPMGLKKNVPKVRLHSADDIRETKESLFQAIEEKLRFTEDTPHSAHQQEYKVSNFEQRLMSEIEFRLERTPVEESDDEVQHDDIPTGKCIAPIFDKKLKNFKAMEGVPVTLSCKVVGIPVPKVYWFKDGKQILRKNTHYRKIREGDGICSLHIGSTTNDDDGNYTIMAANPQGRISCSGHLIIQTGPPRNRLTPIHSQRVRARIQEVESEQTQERFFQPHFLQAPGDMLAHEGRLCRLDCKVSGLPNPELMWLVNGRPIYPDMYHKMLVRENGVHSLVIDPLTKRDAGIYTCIASNKAGQSSFSLELKVVEKEMKHPPQFLEKLQNMGIPEGTPVRLECRVMGMPPPAIFWKKDNDTIPKTKDRISMTQDASGYVCLLIHPTTRDDAGWYTVSAKNEAGIISCTCRLDIYAQWHQNIPAPMRKAPRTGSCYAALAGQGLDIKSTFATSETSPILFSSSPPEAMLESEEL